MNNRLKDLGIGTIASADSTGHDIEEGTVVSGGVPTSSYMQDFFKTVELIKANIKIISDATKEVYAISDKSLLAHTSTEEEKLSKQLMPVMDSAKRSTRFTKQLLDKLKNENDQIKKTKPKGLSESDVRVRLNLSATLTSRFVAEVKEYQQAQHKYKGDITNKVKRQVKIIKPDATDAEIDAVLKTEGGRDALYKEKILTGVADPIKDAYAHVTGKYQDVLALEASIQELYQLFSDFAILTKQQGEMIDNIEQQVSETRTYVQKGNEEIKTSIQHQKSIRKKQCCIIGVVIIGLIVVLFGSGALNIV